VKLRCGGKYCREDGYLKPADRERLIAAYDDRAADCYAKVVIATLAPMLRTREKS